MAKLEIPSIVVHSGSPSVPGVNMDRPARQTPQLRKQKSSMDDGETGCMHHAKLEHTSPSPNNTNSSNNNNNQESTPKISDTSPGSGKPSSPGGPNSKADEVDKPASGLQPQLSRSRSNGKMKMLTRSHAMREATSPPPDPSAATPATSAGQTTPSTVVGHSNGKNNSQASKHINNHSGSSNHHASNNGNSGSGNGSNNNNNNSSKSKGGNNNNNNNNNKNIKEQCNYNSNRNNHRQNKTPIYISSPQEAWSGLLNRDNSTDSQFQDASKADLDAFIAQQMSTKNRSLLLRVEDELIRLVEDTRNIFFKFPQMTSFHRMLVHRAANYFNMDHNLDGSGACVVVNRNRNSKRPERSFLQIMKDVKGLNSRAYSSEEPRKSILKRDFASFEDSQYKSDEKQLSLESRRSKSFEEREEEYERARRRIFSRDDSTDSCLQNSDSNQDSMEDVRWSECAILSGDEPEPSGRYLRPNDRSPRLMKTESYESRDSLKGNPTRSAVSKSYSFGGYTGNSSCTGNNHARTGPNHGQSYIGLHRGDSNASSLSTGSRILAKQDSGSSASSRLSPSSSGYKSQSQQSDATLSATPSPTATPVSLLPMSSLGSQDTLSPEPAVIWPISCSGGNIPPGSVLINPATGQPICNADGTVYRFDPENPLKLHVPRVQSPPPSFSARQTDKPSGKGEARGGRCGGRRRSAEAEVFGSPRQSCARCSAGEEDDPWSGQSASTSPSARGRPGAEADSPTPLPPKVQQPKSQGQAAKQDHGEATKGQAPVRSGEAAAADGGGSSSSSSSSSSLQVVSHPSVTSAATSPMLLASPQRPAPPPAPAMQIPPPGAPGAGAQGFSMPPGSVVSVVPYYPAGYGFTPAPAEAPGQYYAAAAAAGHGSAPGPPSYHMAQHGYAGMVGVEPVFTQPPPGPAPPPPAPCCLPGYPCPYASTSAPPPAPHPGGTYDQRPSVSLRGFIV
ncbi:hypothetical protein ONE63_004671 [Megalurothrips usitatus]|uniref:Protein encore n=1 Tax=Megalurothrips usitatus TaxID=439358 RepID=A0AAV7X3L5_9NEOP|nr:hypothetical protein ONE63_004671 [Megalurothrips usitatus]